MCKKCSRLVLPVRCALCRSTLRLQSDTVSVATQRRPRINIQCETENGVLFVKKSSYHLEVELCRELLQRGRNMSPVTHHREILICRSPHKTGSDHCSQVRHSDTNGFWVVLFSADVSESSPRTMSDQRRIWDRVIGRRPPSGGGPFVFDFVQQKREKTCSAKVFGSWERGWTTVPRWIRPWIWAGYLTPP